MRRTSRLADTGRPVLASNTTTPTGEVSTRASRSARARCSARWARALAMAVAACEAKSISTSSSSPVNAGAPAFPARKKWPTVSPRWRIGVPRKVFERMRSAEKPRERTSAGRSVRRTGPGRSRRCANSRGPSGHSANWRCSASVKPDETKSRTALSVHPLVRASFTRKPALPAPAIKELRCPSLDSLTLVPPICLHLPQPITDNVALAPSSGPGYARVV